MESYKIKKDINDKNLDLMLNGIHKKLVKETFKSKDNSRKLSTFDNYMYQESITGNKISRLQNKKNRISNMIGNKAISFSSIVD